MPSYRSEEVSVEGININLLCSGRRHKYVVVNFIILAKGLCLPARGFVHPDTCVIIWIKKTTFHKIHSLYPSMLKPATGVWISTYKLTRGASTATAIVGDMMRKVM